MTFEIFWPLFVIVLVGLIAYGKWNDLSYLRQELRSHELGFFVTDGDGEEISRKSTEIEILRTGFSLFVAFGVIVFCLIMLIRAI